MTHQLILTLDAELRAPTLTKAQRSTKLLERRRLTQDFRQALQILRGYIPHVPRDATAADARWRH